MKSTNLKKHILLSIPYIILALFATKLGQAVRFAPGFSVSTKFLYFVEGLRLAFQSVAPSFHPTDILVGITAASGVRLVVYVKGRNAKKRAEKD